VQLGLLRTYAEVLRLGPFSLENLDIRWLSVSLAMLEGELAHPPAARPTSVASHLMTRKQSDSLRSALCAASGRIFNVLVSLVYLPLPLSSAFPALLPHGMTHFIGRPDP